MAIADITKPMALDETLQATNTTLGTQNSKIDTLNTNVGAVAKDTSLQATNTALGLLGKDTSLQAIVTALATIGLNTVGNLLSLTTEQKTSLVAAINELNAGKIDTSEIGVANGVAELDNTGKVPAAQLPSFVDDVLEYSSVSAFPATGESGKIYVALDTNKTYRWGGSGYVVISETLALGETSSTAYRGDRGKTAYDHSQDASRVTSATAVGLYKVGATSEGHVSGLTAVQKADITALGIPGQDTTYNDATQSVHGLLSTADKTKLDGISTNAKKVESGTTNGYIKIDGVETQVYDDTTLSEAVEDIQDELSVDTATVEGNPINFSTKSAQTAQSTIIDLEPIQDLHGYDKPWVGGAGVNILPQSVAGSYTSLQGNITAVVDNNGIITLSGTSGNTSEAIVIPIENSQVMPLNTIYVHMLNTEAMSNVTLNIENSDGTIGEYATLAPKNKIIAMNIGGYTIERIRIWVASGITISGTLQPMLCLDNTVRAFSPYKNICAITGRTEDNILGCGKNLCNINSSPLDAFITLAGDIQTSSAWSLSDYIKIESEKSYTLSGLVSHPNTGTDNFRLYDENKNYLTIENVNVQSGYPHTFPDTAKYIQFCWKKDDKNTVQFEIGQVTLYSPYTQSNNLTISFGDTVYGAKHIVGRGLLVVDRELKVYNGSVNENWGKNGVDYYISTESKYRTYYILNCNKYKGVIPNRFEDLNVGEIALTLPTSGYTYINLKDERFESLEDFKTDLENNNLQVVYKLATPITIELTPHQIALLEGVNNISTDGDKITLTYRDGSVATLGDVKALGDEMSQEIADSQILTDTATGDKYILVVTNGVLDIQQVSN